jgi:hypothetical protein
MSERAPETFTSEQVAEYFDEVEPYLASVVREGLASYNNDFVIMVYRQDDGTTHIFPAETALVIQVLQRESMEKMASRILTSPGHDEARWVIIVAPPYWGTLSVIIPNVYEGEA